MERLDECLKVHADMLDAQNIGSIYELQGLSELHYYLKVEHVFTPAEVEALLSFQDPLDVARWCWEENNHEHSFPICDLLKEIDAAQKFEHFTSEPSAQDKYTLLMKRLGQNYFAYRESLMSRDKESLIEKAAEIIGCNTCENIVIHGNGHTDTIALAGTETAGKCNLAVKLILGNSLLKKLYQFFRPFQMAG